MIINNHPLLSPESSALTADELEAHRRLALDLLALAGHTFTGDALATARTALALQVNLQVRVHSDPDIAVASAVTRGSRSITYRDGHPLDPTALQLVDTLMPRSGQYVGVIRSKR